MPDAPIPSRRDRPRERARGRGRRPGRALVRVALALAATAAVFFLGLVVGRAIEDAPRPGGEQTIVRTLVPDTIGPVESVATVTVTTP